MTKNCVRIEPNWPISYDSGAYDWQDVTTDFRAAASSMQQGELVHDANFSLFEAMSAIELMDPKMDAGCQCGRQQMENGSAPLPLTEDVDPATLIALMDATFACLVSWLEGHSLAQTVFTNVYLHKPYEIANVAFKAFSLGILKLVYTCREIIQAACVHEEEDFQGTLYGFDLAQAVTEQRVLGMLKEAEEHLSVKMKENVATNAALAAVQSRLKFTRSLTAALIWLSAKDVKAVLPAANSKGGSRFDEVQKLLTQCEHALKHMEETLGIAGAVREDNNYAAVPGFMPNVNQRLLPPTFPRQTVLLSRMQAINAFRALVGRLRAVCGLPIQSGNYDVIMDFFRDFTLHETCILSRSVLQLAYFTNGERQLLENIKEAMRQFTQPPALFPKSTLLAEEGAQAMLDQLMTSTSRVLHVLLQIAGNNRARQRDKYAQVLEDLGQLQEDADKVDGHFHSILTRPNPHDARSHLGCFSSYMLYHTVLAMINYVLLHFELELYAPYEFVYVYWYLSTVLYKWLLKVLHRADSYKRDQDQLYSKLEKSGSKADKKKGKRKPKSTTHRLEISQHQAYQKLCDAYFKAMVGLQIGGKLKQPAFAYDSRFHLIRYEQRFRPFAHLVTPTYCRYGEFCEHSGLRQAAEMCMPEEIYAQAAQSFEDARASFEQFPGSSTNVEMMNMIKISKLNQIMFVLLAQGHRKDTTEMVTFDFTLNRCFPQIKFQAVQSNNS